MKLTVQNLGRIRSAELDLRPLTLFFGKNGTQKTWTAHAYFKLLEGFRVVGGGGAPLHPSSQEAVDRVVSGWLARIAEATSEVRLSARRADVIGTGALTTTLSGAAFASAIGHGLPHDTSVSLSLLPEEWTQGYAASVDVVVSADRTKVTQLLHFEGGGEAGASSFPTSGAHLEEMLRRALNELAMGWVHQARALPAERANLAQIFTHLISQRDIHMPRALVDFCYMMAIGVAGQAVSPSGALGAALAGVVGGTLVLRNRELLFSSGGEAVPIKAAASLAKSLVGVGVFLADALPGDILVIDEPEMNAHPEAQVAIAELFALMVRNRLRVLVVTHSPYLVSHLASLVVASNVAPEERAALRDEFALHQDDTFLLPEEIAVYDFQGEAVVPVFDAATASIDWSTFTDVNDREDRLVSDLLARET